jgi:hypothetical protein
MRPTVVLGRLPAALSFPAAYPARRPDPKLSPLCKQPMQQARFKNLKFTGLTQNLGQL